MYREVWRLERDFFYDPNHHGLDLKATCAEVRAVPEERGPPRPISTTCSGRCSASCRSGHLYIGGGDSPEPKRVPGGLLGCDFTDRERALPLRARLQRRELESDAAGAADAARRQRAGGRVPARRQRAGPRGVGERLRPVREHRRQVGRASGRAERRRLELARGDRGAGGERVEPALPGLDRGQPPQGGRDERREAGVRVPARHGRRRLHELQPLLLRADRQGRRRHRRAVQRRRLRGRLHRRRSEEAGAELLGGARRDGRHDARRRAAGARR